MFTAKISFYGQIRPNLFGREIILFHGQPKFYKARFLESGRKNGQIWQPCLRIKIIIIIIIIITIIMYILTLLTW